MRREIQYSGARVRKSSAKQRGQQANISIALEPRACEEAHTQGPAPPPKGEAIQI